METQGKYAADANITINPRSFVTGTKILFCNYSDLMGHLRTKRTLSENYNECFAELTDLWWIYAKFLARSEFLFCVDSRSRRLKL